jgi:hypothetical protein
MKTGLQNKTRLIFYYKVMRIQKHIHLVSHSEHSHNTVMNNHMEIKRSENVYSKMENTYFLNVFLDILHLIGLDVHPLLM